MREARAFKVRVVSPMIAVMAMAAAFLTSLPRAEADTFGLVVGIDAYKNLPKLRGATNDARDVAESLRKAGVTQVELLIDQEATHANILAAWARLVAASKPGDTIIFTFAGHGGQERERVPGSEEDGLDEVFLLPGFSVSGPDTAERIPDDEINALFRAVPDRTILFIADSCHSGTMTRAIDPRLGFVGSRLGQYGEIQDDALPQADPSSAALGADDLANVVFFSAVEDDQVALEFAIDGEVRGALSWSFARAMEGQADRDGNKRIDARELDQYLVESVRSITDGRQYPQVAPRGRPNVDVVALSGAAPEAESLPLRVFIVGGAPGQLRSVEAVADPTLADLVWDVTRGQVLNATGDVVAAEGVLSIKEMQPIVDKWMLLRAIRTLAQRIPLNLRLLPDDRLYHRGDKLALSIEEVPAAYLTLFNLAYDGTVQLIAPYPNASTEYSGVLQKGGDYQLPLSVAPPYGADHLVAIIADRPLDALNALLLRLDGTKGAAGLLSFFQQDLPAEPVVIGLRGLFTAGAEE